MIFLFPQVGYISSLEGMPVCHSSHWLAWTLALSDVLLATLSCAKSSSLWWLMAGILLLLGYVTWPMKKGHGAHSKERSLWRYLASSVPWWKQIQELGDFFLQGCFGKAPWFPAGSAFHFVASMVGYLRQSAKSLFLLWKILSFRANLHPCQELTIYDLSHILFFYFSLAFMSLFSLLFHFHVLFSPRYESKVLQSLENWDFC